MRIRTRSIIVALSRGITQGTRVLLGILLVRLISKEILGTYRQVILAYVVLSGVLSLQLDNSLYYFVPKLGARVRRALLGQTLSVTLVLASLVGAIMFFGAGPIARGMNNPRLEPLIRIFALYPLVDQVFCLIPAFMISLDRPLRAGWYTLIRSIGHMGSIVIVFALGYPVSTVLWVAIGFGAVVSAIGVADMAYLSPGGGWRFRGELIKEQMSYAWPLLATAVVGTLNLQFGRLLISAFFDPAVYAVYSCGAFEVPILAVVTTSIAAAMMPNLVVLAKEGKKQAALNLWQEAARKASFLVFPCFAFLLFASADLTVLLYGPPYARAVWPFAIFLGLLPLRVAVYATLFRAFGQTKPLAISAVIALFVNATVSLALVWGCKGTLLAFIGPCIGTLCSAMAMATYLLKTLSRLVGVPVSGLMRWRELGWTLAAALLCGALMFLVPLGGLPLAVKIAVQGIIFTTAFAALAFWTRMLQEDELELLYWPVRTARRLLAGRRPD